jgi:hypothetical protein
MVEGLYGCCAMLCVVDVYMKEDGMKCSLLLYAQQLSPYSVSEMVISTDG